MRPDPSHSVLSAAIRRAATSSSPACVLDGRGAYLFANDAWLRLEAERGTMRAESVVGAEFVAQLEGEDVRRVWRDALCEVLTEAAATRALAGEHNTPDLARLTSTRIEPITSHHGLLGLVLVRTVVRERPIADIYAVSQRPAEHYQDEDGRVTQCPCCRRVRDRSNPAGWEIVRRWVASPLPSARWITCELCLTLHLGLLEEAA